ncbi:hypothetical protein [Methylotenera sp.]|uniref:hypothetical protein n=1 Tax=Methylotenera sp. TaxID=2051956 RepID=UPI002EDA1099
MSLIKLLDVKLKDLMPNTNAKVVTLQNETNTFRRNKTAEYRISDRLLGSARILAMKEGVPVTSILKRLLDEINN